MLNGNLISNLQPKGLRMDNFPSESYPLIHPLIPTLPHFFPLEVSIPHFDPYFNQSPISQK